METGRKSKFIEKYAIFKTTFLSQRSHLMIKNLISQLSEKKIFAAIKSCAHQHQSKH